MMVLSGNRATDVDDSALAIAAPSHDAAGILRRWNHIIMPSRPETKRACNDRRRGYYMIPSAFSALNASSLRPSRS